MEVSTGDVAYSYIFDDAFTAADVTEDEPLEIDFMGTSLTITDVDMATDSVTAQVGEEVAMAVDGTKTIAGKTIKLVNVGTDSAIVSVDGTEAVIADDATKLVNGLRVRVKDLFYSDTKAERQAVMVIGEDALKTYADGDEYIIPCSTPMTEDCDEDSPDWVWVIDLNAVVGETTAGDNVGVELDATWNDAEDPVIKVGDTLKLPGDMIWIKLDSLTESDFSKYTIKWKDGVDLSDVHVGEDSESVFEIKSTEDDGLNIGGVDTDTIYIWLDAVGNEIEALYVDDDNDVVEVTGDAGDTMDGEDTVGETPIIFHINNGDTTMHAAVYDADGATGNTADVLAVLAIDVDMDGVTEDIGIDGGDLYIDMMGNVATTIAAAANFVGMNTPEEAEAEDISMGLFTTDTEAAATALGERDTEVLFTYGDYLDTPEDSTDSDSAVLNVPSDVQEATVIIGGSDTVITAGASATGVGYVVEDTKMSSTDLAKNLIVVGGACVNKVAAKIIGSDVPICGADWTNKTGVGAGQALVKVVDAAVAGGTGTGKVAMLIAGYDATDTTKAVSTVIANKTSTDTSLVLNTAMSLA
jgi:hypothetical protein